MHSFVEDNIFGWTLLGSASIYIYKYINITRHCLAMLGLAEDNIFDWTLLGSASIYI